MQIFWFFMRYSNFYRFCKNPIRILRIWRWVTSIFKWTKISNTSTPSPPGNITGSHPALTTKYHPAQTRDLETLHSSRRILSRHGTIHSPGVLHPNLRSHVEELTTVRDYVLGRRVSVPLYASQDAKFDPRCYLRGKGLYFQIVFNWKNVRKKHGIKHFVQC